MLNIAHLSTSDSGGAGIAKKRLHQGLLYEKIESNLFCMRLEQKYSEQSKIFEVSKKHLKPANVLKQAFTEKRENFSHYNSLYDFTNAEFLKQANIIHIGWTSGFVNLELLPENILKIITLHDMNALTGGCHYSFDCTNYRQNCGFCPELNSEKFDDESHKIFEKKLAAIAQNKVKIIAPSNWIAQAAAKSPITKDLESKVIPHGIDINKFKKTSSRDKFKIDPKSSVVLIGSEYLSKRKGLNYIDEILAEMGKHIPDLVILAVGRIPKDLDSKLNIIYTGYTDDENKIIDCYNCADVFLNPSLQESFGLMTAEAMSCGVPVLAWNTNGNNELISSGNDGLLAEPFDTKQMHDKLKLILLDSNLKNSLANEARNKIVKQFNLEQEIEAHIKFYSVQ